MKFPRNAKPFRGQLDAAPFAGVFFCLVLFLLLGGLLYTPGVRIQLPESTGLPGTDRPTVAVALDARGQLYFENQIIGRDELKARLEAVVKRSPDPLTLLVEADRAVNYDALMGLTLLARSAGIREALLATLPRPFDARRGAPPQR